MRLLHAGFCECGDCLDRASRTPADRETRDRADDHRCTRRPYLPMHGLRALLRSGEGRDHEYARTAQGFGMIRPLSFTYAALSLCAALLAGCSDSSNSGNAVAAAAHASTPEQIARGRYLAKA